MRKKPYKLVGFINQCDESPFHALPIVGKEGRLYARFLDIEKRVEIVELVDPVEELTIMPKSADWIDDFDVQTSGLFAISETDIRHYHLQDSESFFRNLMETESIGDPWQRYCLSKETGDFEYIRHCLREGLLYLCGEDQRERSARILHGKCLKHIRGRLDLSEEQLSTLDFDEMFGDYWAGCDGG